jgi:hypothetical protein
MDGDMGDFIVELAGKVNEIVRVSLPKGRGGLPHGRYYSLDSLLN